MNTLYSIHIYPGLVKNEFLTIRRLGEISWLPFRQIHILSTRCARKGPTPAQWLARWDKNRNLSHMLWKSSGVAKRQVLFAKGWAVPGFVGGKTQVTKHFTRCTYTRCDPVYLLNWYFFRPKWCDIVWYCFRSRFLLMRGERNGEKVNERSKMPATEKDPLPPHPQVRPNWSKGLRTDMKKAELVVFSTPEVVVINDKFPKAKHHFLVLPRSD